MKLRSFLGFTFNLLAGIGFAWLLLHAELTLYLLKMGRGQLHILLNTEKIEDRLASPNTTEEERKKLSWVKEIKNYSVDSLGYKPTSNFTTFFDQAGQPVLWVVTACKPFAFEPYEWEFPLLGRVTYKGFFDRNLAQREYLRLLRAGYDADLSTVGAWSTLGWLPDPVLSSMLRRSKGRLAALLFHELFHATYYAPSSVAVNENLANFISYKATLHYLASDTAELRRFTWGVKDDSLYNQFVFEEYEHLEAFYRETAGMDSVERAQAKQERLTAIYLRAARLPLREPGRFKYSNYSILATRNAFFIDAHRYDGLYDSLNNVLNNVYKGDLRRMIEALKK